MMYGLTGKILRLNLSTGSAALEDTATYIQPGQFLGYKVLQKEVKPEVKATDPENTLVFFAGPLVGTGAHAAARATITAVSPLYGVPATSSLMGGFAPQLKYAGYDALIITGKSPSPVWISIKDNQVKIEDASYLWGMGTKNAIANINASIGAAAAVACIGPAGENLVPMASIVSAGGVPAGGHGAVMGAKNLKAIGVLGTGAVPVADAALFLETVSQAANNFGGYKGAVVPATKQSWSEYSQAQSYWNAHPDLYWGAATPPVMTGECQPETLTSMGLRCMTTVHDFGDIAQQYTTKISACPSCPIGCVGVYKIPRLEALGVSPYAISCGENMLAGAALLPQHKDIAENGDGKLFSGAVAATLADDFGVWLGDGALAANLNYTFTSGDLKKNLPATEYASIAWDQYEAGDPAFLADFFRRIATTQGELAALAGDTATLATAWKLGDAYYKSTACGVVSQKGYIGPTNMLAGGQAAVCLSTMLPDTLAEPIVNLAGCGLPAQQKNTLAQGISGKNDTVFTEDNTNAVAANATMAALAHWSALSSYTAMALGVCPHLYPIFASPNPANGYEGAPDILAQLLSAALGQATTQVALVRHAQETMDSARALVLAFEEAGKTTRQDAPAPWVYDGDLAQKLPSQADSTQMLSLLYTQFGWQPPSTAN